MKEERESPFLWASWLTRLMSGENECEWAAWLKAHYMGYQQVPSDFDSVAWKLEHTGMVSQVRAHLESEGKAVFTGELTRFGLRGSSATLSGMPDLIAVDGEKGAIYDIKTGQPRPSHQAQVLLYMYAIPLAFEEWRNGAFEGAVVYRDHEIRVARTLLDDAFKTSLFQLIGRLSAEEPARKAPSVSECRLCVISEEECPERTTTGTPRVPHEAEVEEF